MDFDAKLSMAFAGALELQPDKTRWNITYPYTVTVDPGYPLTILKTDNVWISYLQYDTEKSERVKPILDDAEAMTIKKWDALKKFPAHMDTLNRRKPLLWRLIGVIPIMNSVYQSHTTRRIIVIHL